MKKITLLLSAIFMLSACNNTQISKEKTIQKTNQISNITLSKQNGYTLMKQFCFSCHLENPSPSKQDQMIAPPIINIQQHYKATYSNKKEFIQAIINWVNKPNENKVLMPGAVRRFNLMPPLPIENDKLKIIASTLYEKDFGKKIEKHKYEQKNNTIKNKLQLNNGKKWKLTNEDFNKIKIIQQKLQQNNIKNVEAYHHLGKDIFNNAKSILLNKKYKSKTLQQIQIFFHNIEEEMHKLMTVKNIEKGKIYQNILLKKFMEFNHYFE